MRDCTVAISDFGRGKQDKLILPSCSYLCRLTNPDEVTIMGASSKVKVKLSQSNTVWHTVLALARA